MIGKYSLLGTGLVALAAAQNIPSTPPAPQGAITGQQADAILTELREIRLLLEKFTKIGAGTAGVPAPTPPAQVSLKIAPGTMMLGDKNAPFTMVEYIDLQCQFCKRFHEVTFAAIRAKLIDAGKLRYYSRDYPLDMHPFAMKAAVATHCAAEQGQFWRMREVLVTNAASLAPDAILGYAKTAGLDTAAFASCFGSSRYDEAIKSSINEGSLLGVQGTPSFVLGKSTADGVTGTIVVGALPYSAFEAEVKKLQGR